MVKAGKIVSLVAILLLAVLAVPFSSTDTANASSCLSNAWVAMQPLGSDLNPGTPSQPFATIQKGIEMVCDYGTVYVAAGTYPQNLVINSPMTLQGSGAPDTIIDGSDCGTVVTILNSPDEPTIISGFTIQNGNQLSSIWDPAKEQVLYAGIKLPSFKISPFNFGLSCGGGIYIGETHIVTLNDCVIKNNAAEAGGGICNYGRLYMNRCTVSGNTAETAGGGIYNQPTGFPNSGKMWLTNCTISGNDTCGEDTAGGGICNAGTMELLNCTIANNHTNDDPESTGGGFANFIPRTAIFKNTIVANNTAGHPGTNNCYNGVGGVITSLGHNLDSENTCHFNASGDLINTDPRLGPLQNNGGPTFTHALLQDSPAIDAGDNNGAPSTDQRGISRPQGPTVDIGAYELVYTPAPPVTQEHPSYSPPMPNLNRYLNPATMSVQFVSVSPRQATANKPVTISTNVINTGDESGNLNVELKINGKVEQMRMVSVGPQATQPIKFTVTKDQPGTYAVDIGGQTGSFTIPGATSSRAPVSSGLIAVLIVGVLILIAVMVLVLSRRPA